MRVQELLDLFWKEGCRFFCFAKDAKNPTLSKFWSHLFLLFFILLLL